jgi:transglutaminase-like putative cysteine protease
MRPIQESYVLERSNVPNLITYNYTNSDLYNNSYDYYQKELPAWGGADREFHLTLQYNITLFSQRWDVPSNITIADYDTSSWLYSFYTSSQPFLQSNNTNIINKAQEIAGGYSSVVEKARAIYLYLVKNMKYELQTEVLGALGALQGMKGDCSEFASLMVAMLRAQGIPARKVVGLGLVKGNIATPEPLFAPTIGLTYNYTSKQANIPGHAWLQYYVPNIGWITVDPTWGQALYMAGNTASQKEQLALEYFNRIDYCHLITSVGDWIGEGIVPSIPYNAGGTPEFPFLEILANPYAGINVGFSFKVTDVVLGSRYEAENQFWVWILGGFSGAVILIVIAIAYFGKNRKNVRYY